ncbi:MAG: L-threonylcarbamoyladenylate synthase [Bacteroidales bacterium]|jgi:tRNA threonylcarbamoyl adenosine modification protein (Sua5/YciO/YrdC/YwlC family)|nr:L-threonylcarbamoyladenylate synthase [Bacteroidales bacterium]
MLVQIFPVNPNPKEIQKVVSALQEGELVIYPTDTSYAIGCDALNVRAVERICKLKGVNPQKANLSIICADMSTASEYAKINDRAFSLLKRGLPGPFTFILPVNSSLPKLYKNRKTVGIRIPDSAIAVEIVRQLGNPLLTTSVPVLEEEIEYSTNPELIYELWQKEVAIVVDGGIGDGSLSTVIDCSEDEFKIIRPGKGEIDF